MRSPATDLTSAQISNDWSIGLPGKWRYTLFRAIPILPLRSCELGQGSKGLGYTEAAEKTYFMPDYTHSLVGALLLSVIFGVRWGKRCATVLGLVSFSHWVLDLVVHRQDMSLLPRNLGHLPRLGFGLWKHPVGSALVELALITFGAWFYWRAARSLVVSVNVGGTRARIAALLLLVCGIAVLMLYVTGLLDEL